IKVLYLRMSGRGIDAVRGTRVARYGTTVGQSWHMPAQVVNATFVRIGCGGHESRAAGRGSVRIVIAATCREVACLDFGRMQPSVPTAPVSYWLREPGAPADPPLDAGEHRDVDIA